MNIKCPKCSGFFVADYKFCPTHQKEYDTWLNKEYFADKKCENGHSNWIYGTMQLTNPPSYPEKDVYRCVECNDVRLERAEDGTVRIMDYEK